MDKNSAIDFYGIYDVHYEKVRMYIIKIIRDDWAADDLTQETFLRAFRKIRMLKDETRINSWLFQIARNLCKDHFRSGQSQRNRQEGLVKEDLFSDGRAVENTMVREQMSRCVQKQMAILPESQKNALWLFEVMGFSLSEIADAMEITVENVKVRLHRARRNFKTILSEKCSFEQDERGVLVCAPGPGENENFFNRR